MRRALPMFALTVATSAGCGGTAAPGPRASPVTAALPPVPAPPRVPAAPAWTFWESVDAPIVGERPPPIELPLAVESLHLTEAVAARWASLPREARQSVLDRGFAVLPAPHPGMRLGDFYASLRDDRIPWVVTMDSLFFLAHLALDRAFADVDAAILVPSLATLIGRLGERLESESRTARASDVARPYLVARGLVAVARALAMPEIPDPAPDLAPVVAAERERVLAHDGAAVSPWLDAPIDYGAMAPVGAADRDDRQSGLFRGVAWLATVALTLEGTGERSGRRPVDVATARVHARAAALLTRLLDPAVDPEAAGAWDRIEGASELGVGDPADLTPRDLAKAEARSEVDTRVLDWVANVVRVDRVRHAAARGRAAPAVRLLAPREVPDSELLQSLTWPNVGAYRPPAATTAPGSPANAPFTSRDGLRALPTGLDVAAWLGSGEARAALQQMGDDAYEGYEDALDRSIRARPPEDASPSLGRHRTPYLSTLDAVETWLAPSAGDGAVGAASTVEWRKRKAEVALAAWTDLRHDATAMSRIATDDVRLPAQEPTRSPVPIFVEPHPEAIAKLVGLVRQVRRAFLTDGIRTGTRAALHALDEVDDLLWTALGAAVYETADEPLPALLQVSLASFPARLRALEATLTDTGSADVPLCAAVHVDLPAGRVLTEATGRIEEAWIAMTVPRTHDLWLAVGASIPHYEIVEAASRRSSDRAWREHLQDGAEPPAGPLAPAFTTPPLPPPPPAPDGDAGLPDGD